MKPGGGSIILRGGFSAAGPGWLVTIEGQTDADKYREILVAVYNHVYIYFT